MLRRFRNSNLLVGVFLLALLAFFAGPGALPRILSTVAPEIVDEGIPCAWLRRGFDRSAHQSLIGRNAVNPISLRVRSSPLPNTLDGVFTVTIVITNMSTGTVAIYYNPDQVRIGDDGVTSGLGVTFNAVGRQPFGGGGEISYPEDDIRLLGPRQVCVHEISFAMNRLPDPSIATGAATVKAYYRNTTRGIAQRTDPQSLPVFSDQGLWVGLAESTSVPIPLSAGS